MKKTTERTKLNIDWDSLFPGDTITIGGVPVEIVPLSIGQLASFSKKLKGFGAILDKEGVTWDNFMQPTYAIKLATALLENVPDVLSEASNIGAEDLMRLPLDIIVEVLNKVLDVNLQSKDSLAKNFQSLTEKFQKLVPEVKVQ